MAGIPKVWTVTKTGRDIETPRPPACRWTAPNACVWPLRSGAAGGRDAHSRRTACHTTTASRGQVTSPRHVTPFSGREWTPIARCPSGCLRGIPSDACCVEGSSSSWILDFYFIFLNFLVMLIFFTFPCLKQNGADYFVLLKYIYKENGTRFCL